jgi:hypothetical protein
MSVFLETFYSKSLCSIFLWHFAVSTPTFFYYFSDIFLISPTLDPSDFLLIHAVRTVTNWLSTIQFKNVFVCNLLYVPWLFVRLQFPTRLFLCAWMKVSALIILYKCGLSNIRTCQVINFTIYCKCKLTPRRYFPNSPTAINYRQTHF